MVPVAYAESFRGGAKVLSQSCAVTNQLGECRRHEHYRVVRGHAPKKFCKITPKNTYLVPIKSEASRKPKKRSHSGGYSNSGARGKNFQKLLFSRKKGL